MSAAKGKHLTAERHHRSHTALSDGGKELSGKNLQSHDKRAEKENMEIFQCKFIVQRIVTAAKNVYDGLREQLEAQKCAHGYGKHDFRCQQKSVLHSLIVFGAVIVADNGLGGLGDSEDHGIEYRVHLGDNPNAGHRHG